MLKIASIGTVLGSCLESDVAIWRNNQAFSDNVTKFALQSMGHAGGIASRLKAEYRQLNRGCAECFGASIACGAQNCWRFCWLGHTSVDCAQCAEEYCQPDFIDCTGLSNDRDWPLAVSGYEAAPARSVTGPH